MRPSGILLNNVRLLASLLALGESDTCPRCNRNWTGVKYRYERHLQDDTWIGFVECPGCRTEFVFHYR